VNTDADPMAALADASRRAMVEILATGPASVADLARQLPVSRPAVSQHLKVLAAAGLVTHRRVGTRHVYRLDPEGLAALRRYLDGLWESALGQFKAAAERAAAINEEHTK
jgi:DNA-binding transcriptional ArsR family regulator